MPFEVNAGTDAAGHLTVAVRRIGQRVACGTYWFYGPGDKSGDLLVTIGVTGAQLQQFYRDVRPAGRLTDPWAVPDEQDVPLLVSAAPVMTLQQLWPRLDPGRGR